VLKYLRANNPALRAANLTDADLSKIARSLAASGKEGEEITAYLVRGTFNDAPGLEALLPQLKNADQVRTTYPVLKEAEALKASGQKVGFELKLDAQGGGNIYDIDLYTLDA